MANLLGAVFAILIGVLGIPEFIQYERAAIDNAKSATVASQLKQISDATQQYVQANATAIESIATATSPATITVAMLEATGYLSTSVSAQNPYGQTWQAQALQPVAGQLQVIVEATGGVQIPAPDLPKIAALAGQQGGFIPYASQYGASTCSIAGTPCMMGSYGGWQVSMAHYANPGSGYVGAMLYFNNGTLTNNYLYRNAVPGNPALNTMNTPLIMGATATAGTACSPIGAIAQDGTGALLSCPTSGNWAPVGGGSWKSPVANYAALPTTGNTLGDVRLTTDVNRAYAWNGTSWVALAVDQNGYLQIPGIATVGAGCSPNGLIAQDGTGLILSCQSGVWQQQGASGLGYSQNWYDVTASRSPGVTYTNTTGKPIEIDVTDAGQGSGAWDALQINGVTAAMNYNSAPYFERVPLVGIVPVGGTYSVTVVGKSIYIWSELR